MARCLNCFKEYGDEYDICPYCGEDRYLEPDEPVHLLPGTFLAGRYLIGTSVGAGGFGIIYKAWDSKLDTVVAVKEFYCSRLVTRAAGTKELIVNKRDYKEFDYRKKRFLEEARTMAKFGTHRSIPNVYEFFEENGTAYIVMELLQGKSLNIYLREDAGGKLDKELAFRVINEVGNALISLHERGILHKDVAPDNIFISDGDEKKIKLLDLGSAKLADDSDKVIDIILKPGYSPPEQYEKNGNIGKWSDVYALGATFYTLLTGIKPSESTNRKENDIVIPPHELDESIPENLSNAIMKAMSVEIQLRYKTVEDFLKSINSQRKVLSLAREKKRRKGRRVFSIVATLVILAVVGCLTFSVFKDKRAEKVLEKATIEVWYSVSNDSEASETKAMEVIKEDFESHYTNVTIELKAIPEIEYESALKLAAEENNLPDLFESSGVPDVVLEQARDVGEVLKSSQAKDCLFLKQYDDYYSQKKQVPLGIEVPMAYVITSGNVEIDYSNTTFNDLLDFGDNVNVAVSSQDRDLIEKNIDVNGMLSETTFFSSTENTSPVLLASSMSINKVRNLTEYEKAYVFYSGEKIYSNFIYEWSLGNGSKAENAAAERLLAWMLDYSYQENLMIDYCVDGQIPINKTAFELKATRKEYKGLELVKDDLIFKR
ncbi:MAG: protein kinase [Lachnospiraceae bacterium]